MIPSLSGALTRIKKGINYQRYKLQKYNKKVQEYKKIGQPFSIRSIEPRYIEIQNIKIPKEYSVSQIIVLPDMNGMGFRSDTYSPKLIGLVTEEQFKETVRNATYICQKLYAKDLKLQSQDPFAFRKKTLRYLILFTIISMFLYILRIYVPELYENDALIYAATVLQIIVVIGVFYTFISCLNAKFEPVNIENNIQNALVDFFDKENQKPHYKDNFITWEVAPRFLWLELKIDFEKNGKKPYVLQQQNKLIYSSQNQQNQEQKVARTSLHPEHAQQDFNNQYNQNYFQQQQALSLQPTLIQQQIKKRQSQLSGKKASSNKVQFQDQQEQEQEKIPAVQVFQSNENKDEDFDSQRKLI